MFRFARDVSGSWIAARGRALRWYYPRRLGLRPFGTPVTLPLNPPGAAGRYCVEWRTADDARESIRTLTERTPWAGYPLPAEAAVVVDLGANVGFSALYWAIRYPSAKVWAVEMDAANADRCRALFALNRLNAEVVRAAVAGADGELTYRRHASHSRHRLEGLDADGSGCDGDTARVRAFTLPSLLGLHGIAAVDVLKVDIEGAEEFLLADIGKWAARVRWMLLELHHNIDPAAAERAVREAGFEIVARDGEARTEWCCRRS